MPDILPPTPPTSNVYMPTLDGGRPELDSAFNTDRQNYGPTNEEFAASISSGPSIVDLINDVNTLQAQNEAALNKYGDPSSSSSSARFGVPIFDENKAFQKASKELGTQSLQASNKPYVVGTEAEFNRYKDSKDFQIFGIDSKLGDEQEFKYGRAMGWGETIGKALSGGAYLAADTFVEGWKGWGRMTEALFTWDSSKLMGSPEERYEMAKKQEEMMNKYAIYDDDTSREGFFNRQFFGNMLQQSGFAVGAGLQFAMEEFLTMGLASAIAPLTKGVMLGRVARGVTELAELRRAAGLAERTSIIGRTAEKARAFFRPKLAETAGELINKSRQVMDVVTGQQKVINGLANGLKTLIPGFRSVEELAKLHKAGAGFAQLAYTGIGGIKRTLSEFNMARSESIYESAGVYKDLTDKLTNEFYTKNKRNPNETELEKIKQTAEDASHDNFYTNIGVLSVMNRIQFGNMFKGFSKSRSLLGVGAASLKGAGIVVRAANLAGKMETRAFSKGLLGGMSAVGDVAKVFGKKEAAWVAAKSIGKGLMKFEGSEGMQELIQTAAQVGYEKYYEDLYHGKKGYSSKMDAILDNMPNPFTSTEGMKTFLMGALTGRLIAPMSAGITGITNKITDSNKIKQQAAQSKSLTEAKIAEYKKANNDKAPEGDAMAAITAEVARVVPAYQTQKQKVQEAIQLFNNLASDPKWLAKEAIANIKVNNLAAANMEEAAANQNKYVFNNTKDSALAKTIAAAIKLDMYDSLRDMLSENGANMSDEEFKQAYGIEPTKDNKKNVESLTKNVVANVEDYYETYKKLIDKYQDRIIPELYKNNKPEDFANANRQKVVLNNVIEMIATNSFRAKQVMKRASALQTEIGANENIGASSLQLLTRVSNDLSLEQHLSILQKEIAAYEAAETKTPELKEVYKNNKEELNLITKWLDSKDEILGNDMTEYSPAVETRAYKAFTDLINLFNKKNRNTATVSKEDIDDNFIKFIDYIKLNKDHGEYVDAMNLLADPKNMQLVAQAEFSATIAFQKKMIDEHIAELLAGTGVPEEDVYKHTYEKQEDGTYTVFDHTGAVVATNIATEEEAKRIAEEKTAEQEAERRRLEEEEALKNAAANKEEIEKLEAEVIRLNNLRVNDAVVAKAIKDFNAQVITADELDAIEKKWNDENGLTEILNKLEELKKQNPPPAGSATNISPYGIIAADYLFTGGPGVMLSTDYFIQALSGAFIKAGGLIEQIRQKYISQVGDLGNLKDAIGTENYDKMIAEIRSAIESTYNNQEVNDIFNIVLDNATGFPNKLGSEISAKLEKLNEELNTLTRPNLDPIFERINTYTTDAELLAILDDIDELFKDIAATPEEEKSIADAVNDRKKVLAILANRNVIIVSKDDPTFVKAYNDVLTKIQQIVSNPDVTVKQVEDAFDLLQGPLSMIDKNEKLVFETEQTIKRNAILDVVRSNIAAKNTKIIKDNITKILSTDDVPINTTIETVFAELNIVLSPEVKDEVITHFEQEYIKAIDRKIAKLRSQVNTGVENPVLKELTEVREEFRKNLEKSLQDLKDKSIQIKDKQAKVGTYLVPDNTSFSTLTHRGITSSQTDKDSSELQGIVIDAFMNSGLISAEEFKRGYSGTRKGASILINKAVGRIYTMQINSAISEFRRSGNTTLLYDSLLSYLKEVDSAGTEEKVLRQQIQGIVESIKDPANKKEDDQELLDVVNSIFTANIPLVENISSEQYKLFEEYRKTVTTLFRENNMMEMFRYTDAQQKQIIDSQDVKSKKIFPDELLAFLDKSLTKTANVKSFREDFIKTFDEIVKSTDPEKTNDLILTLTSTHMKKGMTNIQVIQSLMAYGIETYNLAKTDESDTTPLTDVEMIEVLDNPARSLSQSQIAQVETFAKVEQLDKHKKKLYAAIGYKVQPVDYTMDLLDNKIVNDNFSSLRPKIATDNRSKQDLLLALKVTDGGTKTTIKNALQFILDSEYATAAEKVLASKLIEFTIDSEFIYINNALPAAGVYSVDTNTIEVNVEAASYSEMDGEVVPSTPLETVILHELIHAITEKQLMDQSSAYYKGIKSVFDAVKNQPGAKTFYAFQEDLTEDDQISEFVTEAFTNPSFQYLLSKVEYKNTGTSAWDKFLQFISDLFKAVGIDINNTALSEVLSLTEGIMPKQEVINNNGPLPSEKFLEKIKNAKTKEDLLEIYKELELEKDSLNTGSYTALASSINRKLDSINAIDLKKTLKDYTLIKVDGVSYYYNTKNNKINIVKRGNYRLNNVKNAETVKKIVDQILSKQKITELLSEDDKEIIKYLGGDPEVIGTYASGQMSMGRETIFERRYPNIERERPQVKLKLADAETYKKFKADYRLFLRKKLTLQQMYDKYGSYTVSTFAEIYGVFGGEYGRKQFKEIDNLVRRGLVTLNKGGRGIGDYEDDGIFFDDLMSYWKDRLAGINLEVEEERQIEIDINKMFSKFLGIPVNSELQKKLEMDIFQEGITFNDPIDEDEDDIEDEPEIVPTTFTIKTDLSTAEFIDDPNSLDITTMKEGQTYITAVEKNALRSKGNDGMLKNGDYVENENFKLYYYKVRNIINKLALLPYNKIANWNVTLDMDSEGLRWDGSSAIVDWSKRGVVGYISDEYGNPIVFDKDGKAIGRADRKDPGSSRFNTGENQIVYFNTATANTSKDSLALFEKTSLEKLLKTREAVIAGKPQIGKIQKISHGQMTLKGLVKPGSKNQKNTARDVEFRDMLTQDHVSLELIGPHLTAVITDSKGGMNGSVLFTPSTSAIKINTPQGEFGMFDHLVELMKTYHELKAQGYSRIGDIESQLKSYTRNMWYTGSLASLEIHKSFNAFTLRRLEPFTGKILTEATLSLFKEVNGEMVVNEDNYKRIKAHVNNTKINVYKGWLESNRFGFPFITIDDSGKKMINFEEKNYKDFLLKDIGLVSYISDVPAQGNIKRYNSTVHFTEPTDLDPKKSDVVVDEKEMINNDDAMNNAVDDAVKNATPAAGKIVPITKGKRFAPKFDKPYEKICK